LRIFLPSIGLLFLAATPAFVSADTFTDFEPVGFADGDSVDDLQPDGTTIAPPMSFGNSCREAWFVPTAGTDEEIVDLATVPDQPGLDADIHGKVWRLSNGAASGALGQNPHSPRNPDDVSGETGSLPNDACGPSSTANYYAQVDFRSVTGAHQEGSDDGPGPMRLAVVANSSDTRQAFLYITDNGSGLDLTYFETADGCLFPATEVATGLSYSDWHTLGIEILFNDGLGSGVVGSAGATGNDVVNIYVNSQLVHTGTTWESCVGSRVVDQLLFETRNHDEAFLGGGLYFDNVLITDVCPPGNCGIANPTIKDDCKNGGWADFGFINQGQCIRFVNTGQDSR
jgi:hypothetical protein